MEMVKTRFEDGNLVKEYDFSIDPKTLKNFKEECKDYLRAICEGKKNICLFFSGGCDSTIIFFCLKELNIPFKMIHYSVEGEDVTEFKTGIEQLIEHDDIIDCIDISYEDNHKIVVRNFENGLFFPQSNSNVLHYLMDHFNQYDLFLTGVGAEWKLSTNGSIEMITGVVDFLEKNKGRLYNLDTSRIFLSYLNDEAFKQNYEKEIQENEDVNRGVWRHFIRGLIFKKYFPMVLETKREYIFTGPQKTRDLMYHITTNLWPHRNYKNYFFDPKQYFQALEKNENT